MDLPANDNDPLLSMAVALERLAALVESIGDLAVDATELRDTTLAVYQASLACNAASAAGASGRTS